MSDPKLKKAMSEIFGILKKHDIAGSVILVSQTHSEHRFLVDTSWSCARFEFRADGPALIFKAKKADIPDDDERHKRAEETAHILFQIRDLSAMHFMGFDSACNQLKEVLKIEHTPFSGFEPHREN